MTLKKTFVLKKKIRRKFFFGRFKIDYKNVLTQTKQKMLMYVKYDDNIIEPYLRYKTSIDTSNNSWYFIWLNNCGVGRYRYIKIDRNCNEEGYLFISNDHKWEILADVKFVNANFSFSNEEFIKTEVPQKFIKDRSSPKWLECRYESQFNGKE